MVNTKTFLITGIAALAVLAGIHVFKNPISTITGVTFSTTSPMEETVTKQVLPPYKGEVITEIGDDLIIKQVPEKNLKDFKDELAELKISLIKNPENLEGWMRVGGIKKFLNNYFGARDAWEYAKIVDSQSPPAYYNLGVIYGSYLNDFPKAEENYLQAIKLNPKDQNFYLGLAEFYAILYKEKAREARAIILRGLKILPEDKALLRALENYKQ